METFVIHRPDGLIDRTFFVISSGGVKIVTTRSTSDGEVLATLETSISLSLWNGRHAARIDSGYGWV